MKRTILVTGLLCLTVSLFGQTAVNSANAAADANAELDVASTTRGVILPMLTNAQMLAIGSPATGLIIYNSTNQAYYYFNGSIWAKIGTKGKILQDANADTKVQVEKTTNDDKIRIDVGNGGTPIQNMVVIDNAGITVQKDFTIPSGKTLKIGATPNTMPSTAGNISTVLASNGAGTWSWMEPHGGLGIAAGIQTMYFAEATSDVPLGSNTIYTPVIPFSTMTITKIEAYAKLNGTTNPVLRFAIFDKNGNNLGYGDSAPLAADGEVQVTITPYAPAVSIFLNATELYYFAVTEINDLNVIVLGSNGPYGGINPINKSGGATDEINTATWSPVPTSYIANAVWMVAH